MSGKCCFATDKTVVKMEESPNIVLAKIARLKPERVAGNARPQQCERCEQ
jgi:hypothetical protein